VRYWKWKQYTNIGQSGGYVAFLKAKLNNPYINEYEKGYQERGYLP
jgi:hypothetical protein